MISSQFNSEIACYSHSSGLLFFPVSPAWCQLGLLGMQRAAQEQLASVLLPDSTAFTQQFQHCNLNMACLSIVAGEFGFINLNNCYLATVVLSSHNSRDVYHSTLHYVWENKSSYLNIVVSVQYL